MNHIWKCIAASPLKYCFVYRTSTYHQHHFSQEFEDILFGIYSWAVQSTYWSLLFQLKGSVVCNLVTSLDMDGTFNLESTPIVMPQHWYLYPSYISLTVELHCHFETGCLLNQTVFSPHYETPGWDTLVHILLFINSTLIMVPTTISKHNDYCRTLDQAHLHSEHIFIRFTTFCWQYINFDTWNNVGVFLLIFLLTCNMYSIYFDMGLYTCVICCIIDNLRTA